MQQKSALQEEHEKLKRKMEEFNKQNLSDFGAEPFLPAWQSSVVP